MKVIGFAGTAKNTGKTKTASRVLAALRDRGYRVAVTSIGYDGENIDNVTGLPKPLYDLKAGDIIATASQCLKSNKPSNVKLLEETGISTILGEIQVVEILKNDTYVLAGPNRRADLEGVLQIVAAHQANFTLIDGALNRIVPMICADGLVLSTGAAFDEDIHSTALHAGGISYLFSRNETRNCGQQKNIQLVSENGRSLSFPGSSLITLDSLEKITSHFHKGIKQLIIPGACYPEMLLMLLEEIALNNLPKELILGNPLFLIASGNPIVWKQVLSRFESKGVKISYCETLPILFLTVNPFYPRYIPSSNAYEEAYVDAERLEKEISAKVSGFPVVNIENVNDQELLNMFVRGE